MFNENSNLRNEVFRFFYARENLVMISKKIEVKSFKNFLKKSKKCFF